MQDTQPRSNSVHNALMPPSPAQALVGSGLFQKDQNDKWKTSSSAQQQQQSPTSGNGSSDNSSGQNGHHHHHSQQGGGSSNNNTSVSPTMSESEQLVASPHHQQQQLHAEQPPSSSGKSSGHHSGGNNGSSHQQHRSSSKNSRAAATSATSAHGRKSVGSHGALNQQLSSAGSNGGAAPSQRSATDKGVKVANLSSRDRHKLLQYVAAFPTVLSMPALEAAEAERENRKTLSTSASSFNTMGGKSAAGGERDSSDPAATGVAAKKVAEYEILKILGAGASGTVLLVQPNRQGASLCTVKITNIGPVEVKSEEALVARTRSLSELHCLMQCTFFSILKVHQNFISSPPKIAMEATMNGKRSKSTNNLTASMSMSVGSTLSSAGFSIPKYNANDELIGLVVEFADSGDLRQEIKRRKRKNNPFREYEACLLFLQLLLGVYHMHSKKIIHRDIKSANVLIFSNGLVKLGDFGFAKKFNEDGNEDGFCGTPYYLAAEVWKQEPYGTKVDIFALGVLFYELLTLERPFSGASIDDVMDSIIAGEFEPLPKSLSTDVRRILRAMLDPNPRKRPSCRQLLRHQYFRMLLAAFKEIVTNSKIMTSQLKQQILADLNATKVSIASSGSSQPNHPGGSRAGHNTSSSGEKTGAAKNDGGGGGGGGGAGTNSASGENDSSAVNVRHHHGSTGTTSHGGSSNANVRLTASLSLEPQNNNLMSPNANGSSQLSAGPGGAGGAPSGGTQSSAASTTSGPGHNPGPVGPGNDLLSFGSSSINGMIQRERESAPVGGHGSVVSVLQQQHHQQYGDGNGAPPPSGDTLGSVGSGGSTVSGGSKQNAKQQSSSRSGGKNTSRSATNDHSPSVPSPHNSETNIRLQTTSNTSNSGLADAPAMHSPKPPTGERSEGSRNRRQGSVVSDAGGNANNSRRESAASVGGNGASAAFAPMPSDDSARLAHHPHIPVPPLVPDTVVRIVAWGNVSKFNSEQDTWKPRFLALVVALSGPNHALNLDGASFLMGTTQEHTQAVVSLLKTPAALNNPGLVCPGSLLGCIVCSKMHRFDTCVQVSNESQRHVFALIGKHGSRVVFSCKTDAEVKRWVLCLSAWLQVKPNR